MPAVIWAWLMRPPRPLARGWVELMRTHLVRLEGVEDEGDGREDSGQEAARHGQHVPLETRKVGVSGAHTHARMQAHIYAYTNAEMDVQM